MKDGLSKIKLGHKNLLLFLFLVRLSSLFSNWVDFGQVTLPLCLIKL